MGEEGGVTIVKEREPLADPAGWASREATHHEKERYSDSVPDSEKLSRAASRTWILENLPRQ